ncbi:MAG: FtsW/RodA/SpoVE family cell cycle protein [bacterium]|nr:FtsW/RodA/SpoVE family cell cycle protein [bacterium]
MRKIWRNIDKPLLIISIILFIIGLIMIFSSSNITAFMKYSASPYRYFFKQSLFLIFSLVITIFIIPFHSKSYRIFSTMGVYLIGALLILLLIYGTVKNAAINWIDLGFFSIQPSEFAKIIIILWLASYYESNKHKLNSYLVVLYPIFVSLILAGLIFVQPDLGTTIIFSVLVASLFFMAPISKEIRNKVLLLLCSCILLFMIVFTSSGNSLLNDRQRQRFDFSNPCSEEKFYSYGNQVCNGYIAINHGGFNGVGLGNSTQKYLYLPEAHTDFIFAIVMEEMGFLFAIVIFGLYFFLIGRIIKIAKQSYNTRGFLICMGVAIYILLHIVVNLGGILGLMPMTGVPLPFMSYGGSFAMCLIFALCFVQRINIENRMYYEKVKKVK